MRRSGTDADLVELACQNAEAIGAELEEIGCGQRIGRKVWGLRPGVDADPEMTCLGHYQ